MARNVVLFVSAAAVLVILFIGYVRLVPGPAPEQQRRSLAEALPAETELASDEVLRYGPAEIPGGSGAEYTRYDEQGRPRDHFRCRNWRPVPDSKNEVFVERPELSMRLPSGMIAVVSADSGQVVADRIDRTGVQARAGWLRGDVRIVIDTRTDAARPPPSARPDELITISMERLEFDLELGELESDTPFTVTSSDFQVSGRGIRLVWNRAENRVERLQVLQGRQLTLYPQRGFLAGLGGGGAPAAPARPAADTRPAPRGQPGRRAGHKRTAYTCILRGGIVAEHLRGRELVGRLEARELRLLFDLGGQPARWLAGRPTTAPAGRRPAEQRRERLVVRWQGGLRLEPAPAPPGQRPARRRLLALGEPLRLTRGQAAVRCARLEYHDESGQIWLYPAPGGRVDFALREDLRAAARSVYVDQAANVVKLIGDVVLDARGDPQSGRRAVGIRCALWGELHLSPAAEASPVDELAAAGRLESATFVGRVRVRLPEDALEAHRLELRFRRARGDEPLEALLSEGVAAGEVRLEGADQVLTCGRARVEFGARPDGARYPRALDAVGAVVISRSDSRLRGDRVVARLEPWQAPGATGQRRGSVALRSLRVLGRAGLAGLADDGTPFAARGQRISATLGGDNELLQARVTGTPQQPALVYYRPYEVSGQCVELDAAALTVHVDGPSRLKFNTRRGLRGQRRERPLPIEVTSQRRLHIDGRRNAVHLNGDVVASSADDRLRAAALTLLLEDVAQPPAGPLDGRVLRGYWRRMRAALLGRRPTQAARDRGRRGPTLPGQPRRAHKEPLRLIARQAVVQREIRAPGEPQPLVHSSLAAPELEVDLRQRIVQASGRTTLLLTDRRLHPRTRPTGQALGLPPALITRGPSQSAMQCDSGLTYVFGGDEPDAQDQVLFRGRVIFRHVAGRELVNPAQMLPDVVARPQVLEQLPSRNTYLECQRLECGLAGGGPRARPAGQSPRMRLAWLIATGDVYIRDQQESVIRTVYARQVEFDRAQGVLRVLGWDRADARIYSENPATGQFDLPAVGPHFTIDLRSNTIRAGQTRGELRRP